MLTVCLSLPDLALLSLIEGPESLRWVEEKVFPSPTEGSPGLPTQMAARGHSVSLSNHGEDALLSLQPICLVVGASKDFHCGVPDMG